MPTVWPQYSPKVRVRFWTQTGEQIDVTGDDLLQVHTSASINAPTATWSVLLSGKRVGGRTFADRIKGLDYCEIEIARVPSAGGALTLSMRGFVDNSQEARDTYTRRVSINGRNFGALWLRYQVYFLTEIDPAASLIPGARLEVNFGIPAGVLSPSQFVQLINDRIVAPNLAVLQQVNRQIPSMRVAIAVPDSYAVNGFTIQPFTGSAWNLLSEYADQPWIETFIYDAPAAPTLVFRLAPYKDATGSYIQLVGAAPEHHTIRANDVISQSWGTSANELFSYYFTYPQYSYIDRTAFKGEGINLNVGNPYVDPRITRWGFTPLERGSKLIPSLAPDAPTSSDQAKPEVLRLAAELNQWMVKAFQDNDTLLSGQATIKGAGGIQPGEYVTFSDAGKQFYVASVDHTFNPSDDPGFTTTLGLVRGR